MKRIESATNPWIKDLRRRLAAPDSNLFLIEGRKLLREAAQSGIRLREILVTGEAWDEEQGSLPESEGEAILVSPSVMNRLSDVKTPPGIIGVAYRPPFRKIRYPKRLGCVLCSIRDPANAGGILRAAEAAGCEFLALTPDSVDPFHPKVVRASMGSLFRVPVFEVSDLPGYLRDGERAGIHMLALRPHAGVSLFDYNPRYPLLVLIGSESHGLPEELSPHDSVSIPMAGHVESLNAAVAAALCFYAVSGLLPRK